MANMYDTQAAMDRQIVDDAYKAGQLGLGGGMMFASSGMGDLYNQGLMGLAGMMGGEPDPRIAKQQAILEIQQRFPEPDTFEEFMDLYNALRMGGFYEFAEQALKAANDLRNSMPAPTKPGAEIEKYNEAVKGGYEGSFFQYQMDLKKAGADKTTMMPTPAKGFQYQQDENGNWIATIIPGGSADLEIKERERASIQATINKQNDAAVVLKNVKLIREAILDPKEVLGFKISPVGFGAWLSDVPGTPAKGVKNMIKVIEANIGFGKLQAMREASPTGGALGQVSNIELDLLKSVIGSLEQSQSADDVLRVLNQIEQTFNMIVHGQITAPTTAEETEKDPDPLGIL